MNREIREATAYILGGLGFLHELFLQQAERPFLLTASLALMGFPLVFKTDELLAKRRDTKQSNPDVQDMDDGKEE